MQEAKAPNTAEAGGSPAEENLSPGTVLEPRGHHACPTGSRAPYVARALRLPDPAALWRRIFLRKLVVALPIHILTLALVHASIGCLHWRQRVSQVQPGNVAAAARGPSSLASGNRIAAVLGFAGGAWPQAALC